MAQWTECAARIPIHRKFKLPTQINFEEPLIASIETYRCGKATDHPSRFCHSCLNRMGAVMTPTQRGAAAMRAEMERYDLSAEHGDDFDEDGWDVLDTETGKIVRQGTRAECQAFIDQRAFAAGQEAMWQPIATAPMDGTVVDLWRDSERLCGFRWSGPSNSWIREHGYPAVTTVLTKQPTHWQPLPPPPAANTGDTP